jgi:hypothetical protein
MTAYPSVEQIQSKKMRASSTYYRCSNGPEIAKGASCEVDLVAVVQWRQRFYVKAEAGADNNGGNRLDW